MRTQLAVSVTRAATFSSRSLIVVNGLGEGMCLGNGVAHGEGQPIGGGVQESRIWLAVAARQQVRSEVQLDQVLGLAAGAIKVGIKPFGRPARDVGDDVANVETEPRRLDAGCDAALPRPGLSRAVVSAKPRTASLSSIARSTRIVGELVDLRRESLRAGEAEDVIDAVRLTPVHDLRPTIVSVPADGDASRRSNGGESPGARRRIWPRTSTPEGVLPGRRIMATGRPVAVS